MAQRTEIESHLSALLAVDRFKDYGPNGLQVEGRPEVQLLVSGVTASLALIEAAVADGADAILVHHGLFWRGQSGCITGWMKHHRGLAGLIAPTTLSYARLQPASMSGYWCNWGGDHRGVTVRVSSEGDKKARLEHRMADASANPYTAVAAVLRAAELGVERRYPLPPPEAGDCFERTDAGHGVAGSLGEAMDDLAADTNLCAAVGVELCENHIFMKRAEVDKTKGLEGDALRDFYIWFV